MSKYNHNICFIANFNKTFFFDSIAVCLRNHGINIFWITTHRNQYKFLVEKYSEDCVLLINRKQIKKENAPVGDFKLNELLFGDRALKYDLKDGYKFLTNIQKPIYDFIKKSRIHTIFGEVTWAHELLIHRMVSQQLDLKCRYLSMHPIRIPNGRFAFFEDEKLTIPLKIRNISSDTEIGERPEKPDYLKMNDILLKKRMSFENRFNRLIRFVTGKSKREGKYNPDFIVKDIHRWKQGIQAELNGILYKWCIKRYDSNKIKGFSYIYFGLHKQPEASIDVCGRYFENQLENVINLWRQLPPKWYLVVKEHTNAIGDRSCNFYMSLRKYPGIILINEKTDSHQLIENSKLVVSNTGTMALEAALLGIPSITLSPVFFNTHNYCNHYNWTDIEKHLSIVEIIEKINTREVNNKEYKEFISYHSYKGFIGDPITNPSILESENTINITSAILDIIEK